MEKIVSWMWFLFTPEDSIRCVSRGIYFACREEIPGYAGKLKAIVWIFISIAASCVIACLHS